MEEEHTTAKSVSSVSGSSAKLCHALCSSVRAQTDAYQVDAYQAEDPVGAARQDRTIFTVMFLLSHPPCGSTRAATHGMPAEVVDEAVFFLFFLTIPGLRPGTACLPHRATQSRRVWGEACLTLTMDDVWPRGEKTQVAHVVERTHTHY